MAVTRASTSTGTRLTMDDDDNNIDDNDTKNGAHWRDAYTRRRKNARSKKRPAVPGVSVVRARTHRTGRRLVALPRRKKPRGKPDRA
jgi:hypothetical protein